MVTQQLVITQQEAVQIAQFINPKFNGVLGEYDFGKYPASPYARIQSSFSKLDPTANEIKDAMIWKWGHWGKPNFPQHHRDLISEIQENWQPFCRSGQQCASVDTFSWWEKCLSRNTTYITVAYITHLVHHMEPLPIIDQHNSRAMNNLVLAVRPGHRFKKKPSNWQDIQNLKIFMNAVCANIPGLSIPDFDKFLMMYGRSHVPR